MLYKWSQCQGECATLKALLHCVEFELGDRELAQRIVDTLGRENGNMEVELGDRTVAQ